MVGSHWDYCGCPLCTVNPHRALMGMFAGMSFSSSLHVTTICFHMKLLTYCGLTLGIGHQQRLSRHRGQFLQLSPCMASSIHICLQITAPGVSWSASFPFPLWIPKEGMSCGAGCRLAKSVTIPSPTSSEDFFLCRLLSCSLTQFLVADNIWPANLWDSSKAGVVSRSPLHTTKQASQWY